MTNIYSSIYNKKKAKKGRKCDLKSVSEGVDRCSGFTRKTPNAKWNARKREAMNQGNEMGVPRLMKTRLKRKWKLK